MTHARTRGLTIVWLAVCIAAATALSGCAASCSQPVAEPAAPTPGNGMLTLTSTSFPNGSPIPARHATKEAGGQNVSPELTWTGAPEGAKSFAVLCVDRHPIAREWVHWMVADLPAGTTSLADGASAGGMPAGARQLRNSFGSQGWGGPQPPTATGVHEYAFYLYALDVEGLELPEDADLAAFRAAVGQHELAVTIYTGTFER